MNVTQKLLSDANETGSIETWGEEASPYSGRLDQMSLAVRNLCPPCKNVDQFGRCQPRNLCWELHLPLAKGRAFTAPVFVIATFLPSTWHCLPEEIVHNMVSGCLAH